MKLAFTGHSIVNGYPFGGCFGFPAVLEEDLPEGNEVCIFGADGESSGEICARFEHDALACSPDIVFVMAGTNDFMMNSAEDAMKYCVKMREKAQAKGVKFVHIAPPPINMELAGVWMTYISPASLESADMELEAFSGLLKKDAAENGCGFIDCYNGYPVENGLLDGVHPTYDGQRYIADLCLAYLKENFEEFKDIELKKAL